MFFEKKGVELIGKKRRDSKETAWSNLYSTW